MPKQRLTRPIVAIVFDMTGSTPNEYYKCPYSKFRDDIFSAQENRTERIEKILVL